MDRDDRGGGGPVPVAPEREAPAGEHVIDWRNSLAARRAPTRGRPQHQLLRVREPISPGWRLALVLIGLSIPILLWVVVSTRASGGLLVPGPAETWQGLARLYDEGVLWGDIWASCRRILIGYAISMAIAVVLGTLMGAFRSADSVFETPIAFIRYIPATALVPLMLFWLGIDELPKVTLIVIGSVFFNILMVADVVRNVPKEIINASYTLGASRLSVMRRVMLPHSLPGIIDVARINLAAAWSILVVAELLAAEEGLAFRIVRAQRFRQVDEMFALLLVFGVIGVLTDLSLRWLRHRAAPWARA
jgi:NitT/TauT family transport system permease protein